MRAGETWVRQRGQSGEADSATTVTKFTTNLLSVAWLATIARNHLMATTNASADALDGINGEQKMLKIENASVEPLSTRIP